MGFGHRVYRSGDSRVPTMKKYFMKVAELVKNNNYPKIYEILERVMLEKKIYIQMLITLAVLLTL